MFLLRWRQNKSLNFLHWTRLGKRKISKKHVCCWAKRILSHYHHYLQMISWRTAKWEQTNRSFHMTCTGRAQPAPVRAPPEGSIDERMKNMKNMKNGKCLRFKKKKKKKVMQKYSLHFRHRKRGSFQSVLMLMRWFSWRRRAKSRQNQRAELTTESITGWNISLLCTSPAAA